LTGLPEPRIAPEVKFGRWLAVLRALLALAALGDLISGPDSFHAAVCALGACLPLERWRVPSHLLGFPAAFLGGWSIHRTGMEAATGLQLALAVLPLTVALAGTLRAQSPLYRVP
jgi:hypothetical protein